MKRVMDLVAVGSLGRGILVLMLLLSSACSSLPNEAPPEFYEAQLALRRAQKFGVDTALPQTMARAYASLNEGLSLLKNSRLRQHSAKDYSLQQMEAIAKAKEARALIAKAQALDAQVKAWDVPIEPPIAFPSTRKRLTQLGEYPLREAFAANDFP